PDCREHVARDGPPRGAVQPLPDREGPAAPHRVEVDQRAVLVEDDEIDAVEQRREVRGGHTSATTSTSGAGPEPTTRQASGGNDTTTTSPIDGGARWGSLNESNETSVP